MASASYAPGLIDTNILIAASRNVPQAMAFLGAQQTVSPVGVQMSVIPARELVAGCRNAAELARLKRFLRRLTVWPLTAAISQNAY